MSGNVLSWLGKHLPVAPTKSAPLDRLKNVMNNSGEVGIDGPNVDLKERIPEIPATIAFEVIDQVLL
jgi:hypothetical protein